MASGESDDGCLRAMNRRSALSDGGTNGHKGHSVVAEPRLLATTHSIQSSSFVDHGSHLVTSRGEVLAASNFATELQPSGIVVVMRYLDPCRKMCTSPRRQS